MIRSMTGFGAAEGEVGGAQVAVEVRSVNHRFFNPTIKLPSQFARWESEIREALRRGVTRGHVTLSARVEHAAGDGTIDEVKFGEYVEKLRDLQRRHGLVEALDVGTVLRLPDVLVSGDKAVSEGSGAEIVAIVERALQAMDAMRA